ncbi:TfoX/Sxy family protein [Parasegetibacter sp. NRK P23]|uniref:TfoX/Sxy family protein n=1 Tax=Parasegetibacter sp. NRK P23 TaxID=2942999 RepID=UPI002042F457|nr:TfoX/Sxy family protein [Parasegetibacter sp. NRK P23]MCM5528393.1 TfoX/Sxy family protein [Parasegetibacter sp. NRK P23]
MSYNTQLAEQVRTYLSQFEKYDIEEKEMFRGLAFMVNGKMCVNVSGENLMCRFDPSLLQEVAARKGYRPMIMKGKPYKGYCYVEPSGFKNKKDFEYWINLCLAFNEQAKASKKKTKKQS